jgi:hypothetical protein
MKRFFFVALLLLVASASASSQERKVKGDWKIPSPDIPSHYDADLKADIYDLGDGFEATRTKVRGHEVAIVGFKQIPGGISESDFALAVASKVLNLPKLLKDTVLEQKDKHEHLFRTALGSTAGVTIAHDRKTAVVRLLPEEEQ